MRVRIFAAAAASAALLSGCSLPASELTEYTLPEESVRERSVTEDPVDEAAYAVHEPAKLDPGFLELHGYDAGAFEASAAGVGEGIAQARADYDLAWGRYTFWSAVMDDIDVGAMLADAEAAQAELTAQLEKIAAGKEQSLLEFAASLSLTEADLYEFLEEAAAELASGETVKEICSGLAEAEAGAREALYGLLEGSGEADAEGLWDAVDSYGRSVLDD